MLPFRSWQDGCRNRFLHSSKSPDRRKTCRGPFLMGAYHSIRRLYSDTLVSVMMNSTPP